ncbi:hypothetical protein BJ165DRAFT_1522884 [Panaeolus papilionaceus]|nr:hypothetical protein BJ165DRAFT_1522884 [Panaeolus papilionaceus]
MSEPGSSTSKAIGSLAKKQSDVTRQGTHKLKFVPTLPQRRKKEQVKPFNWEVKPVGEPTPAVVPPAATTERGRGRGRGRGDVRGRGRGRGGPPVVEMTASGPFALGPALAGSSARHSAPSTSFVPSVPTRAPSSLSEGLSQTPAPSLKRDLSDKKGKVKVEDEEVYSDPDEGVEIVDMEKVKQMDWMAPDSLRKERPKRPKTVKTEDMDDKVALQEGEKNIAPALLSETDDDDELEDIIEDFSAHANVEEDGVHDDKLYLFHFPSPFPSFTMPKSNAMDIDPSLDAPAGKKVSFADGQAPEASTSTSQPATVTIDLAVPTKNVDGVIGELQVYKSGAIKMRLANGIILDVRNVGLPRPYTSTTPTNA